MLNSNGQIVFKRYQQMEKMHGADRTIALLYEITARLEETGYLYTERYTDKEVAEEAERVYQELLEEWTDDPIPYKNIVEN